MVSGAIFSFIVIVMIVKFNSLSEDAKLPNTNIVGPVKGKPLDPANSSDPFQVTPSVKNKALTSTSNTTSPSKNSTDPLDQALHIMLKDNLVINGLPARKLDDGTVIIDTRGRLKTVSVARLNKDGEVVMSEYQESPLQLNEVHNP